MFDEKTILAIHPGDIPAFRELMRQHVMHLDHPFMEPINFQSDSPTNFARFGMDFGCKVGCSPYVQRISPPSIFHEFETWFADAVRRHSKPLPRKLTDN